MKSISAISIQLLTNNIIIKQIQSFLNFALTEDERFMQMIRHMIDYITLQLAQRVPDFFRKANTVLNKANWEKFKILCEQSIDPNAFDECQNPAELFTSLLNSAAEKSIPRTKTQPMHPNQPWFYDYCKKAIAERKSVLRNFNRRPTQENLAKFKIARAKAR